MQGGVGRGYTTEEYWISLANIAMPFRFLFFVPLLDHQVKFQPMVRLLMSNYAKTVHRIIRTIIALSCSSNACMHITCYVYCSCGGYSLLGTCVYS